MKTLISPILLFLLIFSSCSSSEKDRLRDAELDAIAKEQVDQTLKDLRKENMKDEFVWNYSSEEDEMTSNMNRYAQVTSPDMVDLEFPYQEGTYMTLYIREKGGATDAFIKVTTGQLHTDYNNPTVTLRFDENPPEDFKVSDAASGDSEYLFFDNPIALVEKLKSSSKTKIKCMFYNQGSYVFNFDTDKFKW